MNSEAIPGAGVSPLARAFGLGCVCTQATPHGMRGSASASAGPMRVLRVVVGMELVNNPTCNTSKVAQDPTCAGTDEKLARGVLFSLSFRRTAAYCSLT